MLTPVLQQSASSDEEDDYDDFEVVPQDNSDDDADMWDVEGENEDELKQAKIKSEYLNWLRQPAPMLIPC